VLNYDQVAKTFSGVWIQIHRTLASNPFLTHGKERAQNTIA